MLYCDVETTGLDARLDEVRIVSINGKAYDVWDTPQLEMAMAELSQRKHDMFIAHNAQFDLEFLQESLGYKHEGPVFDTMVAFQVLQNGREISASLDNVARMLLKRQLNKQFQKGPWDGFVDNQMLDYAAEDTQILPDLHTKLNDALVKANLMSIFQLEMKLLPVLVQTRTTGIRLNEQGARDLKDKLEQEVDTLAMQLPANLNPRSSQQVAQYFNLENTEVDTMREALRVKPVPYLQTVMDIRKKLKKISTIQKQLLGYMRKDGRIHPSFTQCFTDTGRLSSRNPNLQNQDRGADIRSLFVPGEGKKFVIADYGSLEVRIAAMLAQEDRMLEVLWDGRDLHSETCARIFGEETKETRTLSKNILFGSLFGGGHKTVMRFAAKSEVYLNEKEAKGFQDQLFAAYPKLKAWHKKQGDTRTEYVYSLRGRRCYIPKGDGFNKRINHPVQASAADGQKLAMVELSRMGIVPVANVHDELVCEVPSEKAEDALCDVERVMVECMYRATAQDPQKPVVPIVVEGTVASDWSEKK